MLLLLLCNVTELVLAVGTEYIILLRPTHSFAPQMSECCV